MRKRILAMLLAMVLMLACLPMSAFADSYGSADKARNSVARIVVTYDMHVLDDNDREIGFLPDVSVTHGSCFAIGEKGKPVSYFVTARHAVSGQTEKFIIDGVETRVRTEPKYIYVVMDNEENLHPATLVTDNPGGPDLAVVMLREPTTKREAIYLSPYNNAAKVRNQPVYSVGFPGSSEVFLEGKQANSSGPDMVSVRQGLLDHEVTAVQSGSLGTLLLTDVAITSGNSGGPLVNAKGAVLGVCVLGATADKSMNAAVSVNELVSLLKKFNLPYMTEKDIMDWQMIALGVAALVLIAAVVFLVVRSSNQKNRKSTYRLQGLTGTYAGKRIPLDKDLRIGRDPTRNDLVYASDDKRISGTHCVILVKGDELFIQDVNSTNGTFVNNQRVVPGVSQKLLPGDEIYLADNQNSFKIDVSGKK